MLLDLALILVVAGVVTIIFKALKQPLVLGYIVAGILTAKGIEVGGRKAVEKGKELLDKRIRKVAKEDTED